MLLKLFLPICLVLNGFSQPALAGSAIMPLNPMAALVSGGASIKFPASSAPLHIPQGGEFSYGFTLPSNYAINTPIRVIMLWQTDLQYLKDCQFKMAAASLFVTGPGESTELRGWNPGGLIPLKASTPYLLDLSRNEISFQTPNPPNTTQKVVYKITNVADRGIAKYKPGYAVNFGIWRRDDSCAGDLIISGISLVYRTTD